MRRLATTDTWATVQFDETFTGAAATFPTSALTKMMSSPNVVAGANGIIVPDAGIYMCSLRGYVANIAAGARAYVGFLVNGASVLTAELYVSNTGGQDQSSSHSLFRLSKNDRLTLNRYHSDTGSVRLVSGELTIHRVS